MESQKLEKTEVLSCASCGAMSEACTCRTLPNFDPWIGKRINEQYEIVSLIARGGMGAVYLARHLLLNTFRAVKVIRSDIHRDETVYQRFKQEAQAVMGLSHPNIVSFHEYGIVDATPYVVMDLIEGQSLDAAIREHGKLELFRALEIFVQVAGAMDHAHNKGIFHRDIKPGNIMLVQKTAEGGAAARGEENGSGSILLGGADESSGAFCALNSASAEVNLSGKSTGEVLTHELDNAGVSTSVSSSATAPKSRDSNAEKEKDRAFKLRQTTDPKAEERTRLHETVKVLDFGIAKIQSNEGQKLTSTGEVFGSPVYMSPEQGRGVSIDARSDIYSLGCVMYEALCGQPPFQGNNAIETIMKHHSEKPPKMFANKPKSDLDQIARDYEAIVTRCLEKEPSKRYQSMASLESDLKRLSYGERLLNLQRDIALRRRTRILSQVYKYSLIAFAVAVPVYAVYRVYVDPSSWRNKLRTAMRYQDTADKVIQQLIADLPNDSKRDRNLAELLWNQGQIMRLKSLGEPALLPRAIADYNAALALLTRKIEKEDTGVNIRKDLMAECYDSLARAYLQESKTVPGASQLALAAATNAVSLRRTMIAQRGRDIDSTEDFAVSLVLFAQAHLALGDNLHDVDSQLKEEEKFVKLYHHDSWIQADFLICQADLAARLGDKSTTLAKLEEAAKIQTTIYGKNSVEYAKLQQRINSIKR